MGEAAHFFLKALSTLSHTEGDAIEEIMLTTSSFSLLLSAPCYAVYAAAAGWPLWPAGPLFLAGIVHQAMSEYRAARKPTAFAVDDVTDPLTLSEVYSSYGRHEQARDILLEAIALEPAREDLQQALKGIEQRITPP